MACQQRLRNTVGMLSHTDPVTVFLVEDSAAVRARIAEMFSAPQATVVGAAGTPSGAIAGILAQQPDVVVLDVGMKLETVSRTFSAFQQQGLLEVDKRHIRITDLPGLSRAFEARMH